MEKLKKRKFLFGTVRLLVQILFFFLLPAVYVGALDGIRAITLAVIQGNFSAAILPQLVEVLATIPVTFFFGRFFCGWMCAFGSYTDFVYRIAQKLFRKKLKISEQADRWMKLIKYAILLVLAIAVWNFGQTSLLSLSPWDAFGMLVTTGKLPDFAYVATNMTLGLILLLIVTAFSAVIERFFCRYLCPMGAVFSLSSLLRVARIKKPTAGCGQCRICTENCAMGIPLYRMDTVRSGECIHCMKCVAVCPRNNTRFSVTGSDMRPLVAGTVAAAAMTGFTYLGNFSLNGQGVQPTSSSIVQMGQSSSNSQKYRDGTYQGSGTGFHGGTTVVSVTIKNDRITEVTPVSNQDTDQFFNSAYESVAQEILSSQSPEVDAVSGATFSSNGIMRAVADALTKASV
jgi:polyferredoxin